MFWLIFRAKPFQPLVKKTIQRLEQERINIMNYQISQEAISTKYKDSFEYVRVELAIEIWKLKINILKAIINEPS